MQVSVKTKTTELNIDNDHKLAEKKVTVEVTDRKDQKASTKKKERNTFENGDTRTQATSCNRPQRCLNPFLLTPKHRAVKLSQGQTNSIIGSNTANAGHRWLQ